jgi:O-antigen/teichoic acid export membrane protein
MLLGLALTSMDQVILSRVLPLSEFGYYTIACTMAAALGYVVQPVTTAVYPRFSQLVERGDTPALTEAYHLYSQVVAVLVLPLGLLLACFPGEVLALWMRDAAVARDTGPVLGLRALGTSLNTLMHVPHVLQLAFGWSSLGAYANAVAVVLVAPAMVVLARWYGGVGAALAWVGLNVGYLVLAMARMHRHVLVGQGRRWYAGTLAPGAAVAVVVLASRAAMPPGLGAAATVGWMAATYVLAAAAALLAAPVARAEAVRLVAPGWTR